MTEQPTPESIANLGITREPGYLYYLDKDGNVKRIKKTGKRKRVKKCRTKPFSFVGTKVPRFLLDCYVSPGFREVRGMGDSGSAYVAIPRSLIGKSFRVILVPETYYDKEKERLQKDRERYTPKTIPENLQEKQKDWENENR